MLATASGLYSLRAPVESVSGYSQLRPVAVNSTLLAPENTQLVIKNRTEPSNNPSIENAETRQALFRQLATLDHLPHHQKLALESYIDLQQRSIHFNSNADVVGVDIYV